MEPLFSIQIIQEKDILQFILQVLSPIAIILASSVAAYLANKQYRDNKRTNALYLKSLLQAFELHVVVLIDEIETSDRIEALNFVEQVKKYIIEIVETLEKNRLRLASCMVYEVLHEIPFIGNYSRAAATITLQNGTTNWEKEKTDLMVFWSLALESSQKALRYHQRFLLPPIVRWVALKILRGKESKALATTKNSH